eukprot:GHVU01068391.1.p1 GENE.GHVU01068391.1~~GHVU01068391.1.p1  ORF type:complete len:248 (-),score=13.31 GHVU01068391.1:121-864(-)
MLRGGVLILKDGQEWMHCYNRYTMLWAPFIIEIEGQVWIYCCDTEGGNADTWWDHMRIYRFMINLVQKTVGPLEYVPVQEDFNGLIDPCLWFEDGWWYLSVVRLWDAKSRRWWEPAISVSRDPAGPFFEKNYIGIGDLQLDAHVDNIDEAWKLLSFPGHRHCVWSTGDSGIDGTSTLGHLVEVGNQSYGRKKWMAEPLYEMKVSENYHISGLFTAPVFHSGTWYATGRELGWTGMRDKFFIGIAELI